jgi:DNA-binding CsgD family transcriptional regulator
MAGGAPMSPPVARRVLAWFREFRPLERTDSSLSPHETRLLSLLVDDRNLKTAAVELDITRATVAWHMRNIYEKLQGALQRSGLIREARVTFRLY